MSCSSCGDRGYGYFTETVTCRTCNAEGSVWASSYNAAPHETVNQLSGRAICPQCRGARTEIVTEYRRCTQCKAGAGVTLDPAYGCSRGGGRGDGGPVIVLTIKQTEVLGEALAFLLVGGVLSALCFFLPRQFFGYSVWKHLTLYLMPALLVWFFFLGDGFGPFKRFGKSGPLRRAVGCTFYGAAGLLVTVVATAWVPGSTDELYWLTTAAIIGFAAAASAALRAWFLTDCKSNSGLFYLSVAMLSVLGVVSYLHPFDSTACVDAADVRGSFAAVSLTSFNDNWNSCTGTETIWTLMRLTSDRHVLADRPTAVILAFCALVSALLGLLLNLLRTPNTAKPHEPARWLKNGVLRVCLFWATLALPLLLAPLVIGGAKGPTAWVEGPKTIVTALMKPAALWLDPMQPTDSFAKPVAVKVNATANARPSRNSHPPKPGSKFGYSSSRPKP